MRVKCSDIEYEFDGRKIEGVPTQLIVEVENNTDDECASAISDYTGWLVRSFTRVAIRAKETRLLEMMQDALADLPPVEFAEEVNRALGTDYLVDEVEFDYRGVK